MQKRNKSIAAILLLAFLILAFPFQSYALEFIDVPITASYYKAVDKLSNVGVIQGRGDGAFAPGDRTTRAEFCAFLARANGYNANYYEPKELPFPDVQKEYWAYPYISFCYENGYINGMEDGTFCPANYVTDEQAVKMVVCSSGVGNESLSKVGPKWYSGYLNVAQKYNLLNGTRLQISNSANRAFVAQVVYNAMLVGGGVPDSGQVGTNTETDAEPEQDVREETPGETVKPEKTDKTDKTDKVEEKPAEAQKPEADEKTEVTKKPETDKKPVETEKPEETQKPERKPVKKEGTILVVLDPGHNYDTTDTGAVGNGLREQDITYQIASRVKPLLEQNGFQVIMTRNNLTDNVSVESVMDSLKTRADIANQAEADLFLSIHCNAGGASGTETYYYDKSDEGIYLAEAIQKNVVEEVGLVDRGVKTASFVVLRETGMVAALLETGFIDDVSDAAMLASKSGQEAYARGIVRGICEYFGKEYQ